MSTLAIIIPIYNEENNILQLIHDMSKLPNEIINECIFVDDGSIDKSLVLLKQELKKVKFNYKICQQQNSGKTSAIKLGSSMISSTHVVILDSDLELDVNDLVPIWNIVLNNKSDYVFGFRNFLSHSSFSYRYSKGNQLISNLFGLLFNQLVTDLMCGYKLVPTQFLQSLPFKSKNYGLELEIHFEMWKAGVNPYEIEVNYKPRTRLQGKMITSMDGIKIVCTLIIYRLLNFKLK